MKELLSFEVIASGSTRTFELRTLISYSACVNGKLLEKNWSTFSIGSASKRLTYSTSHGKDRSPQCCCYRLKDINSFCLFRSPVFFFFLRTVKRGPGMISAIANDGHRPHNHCHPTSTLGRENGRNISEAKQLNGISFVIHLYIRRSVLTRFQPNRLLVLASILLCIPLSPTMSMQAFHPSALLPLRPSGHGFG